MTDYISRADAMRIVHSAIKAEIPFAIVADLIKGLPSADAEFADLPDIPRAYYERIVGNMAHEINMLKEQLESADAVQGEWLMFDGFIVVIAIINYKQLAYHNIVHRAERE